jgi:hypothetical protein
MLTQDVVFPTPPFWLEKETTLAIYSFRHKICVDCKIALKTQNSALTFEYFTLIIQLLDIKVNSQLKKRGKCVVSRETIEKNYRKMNVSRETTKKPKKINVSRETNLQDDESGLF